MKGIAEGHRSGLDEDDAGLAWQRGIALEWLEELADSRQDVYTLEDGQPPDEAT